jgi:hypothetical protein
MVRVVALIEGDLLVLLAFVTVGSAAPASTSHADLLVSLGLFAVTWFVGGALLRAFNPLSTIPHFLMRPGATYITAGTGALVMRLFLLPSGFFDPFSFLMIWLEGAFCMFTWRIGYKFVFSLIARGGKTRKFSLAVKSSKFAFSSFSVCIQFIISTGVLSLSGRKLRRNRRTQT